jgi:Protein of unknown function (DUF2934)
MADTARRMEDRIRRTAYALWEQAGRPDGNAEMFWHRARQIVERAVDAEDEPPPVQDREDIESDDSFPASDPPSSTGIVGPGR